MQPVPAQRIVSAPSELSENMRPSRSCPAFLLSLMLLAGLVGCGQTSSDNTQNIGSRTNVGTPFLPKQEPLPSNNSFTPVTPAPNPVSLALGNLPGTAAGKETIPRGENPPAVLAPSTEPEDSLAPLVVPTWITKDLDSPDVGTRVRALETWAQSAPPGAVDPLILALENTDERVRARAMELIEQDWARTADAEQ